MSRTSRAGAAALVLAAVTLALLSLLGCVASDGPAEAELDPPAAAVEALLVLRAERSQDASAYAQYLSDPALAVDLARAAAEETSTLPPTPEWETPYVTEETSQTANVVVVWGDRSEYPDWPPANIFMMALVENRWVVNDAQSVTETSTIPPRP